MITAAEPGKDGSRVATMTGYLHQPLAEHECREARARGERAWLVEGNGRIWVVTAPWEE